MGVPARSAPSRRCRSRPTAPNCRAQVSRATFVPVGFPLGPVEGAELALLGALTDSPDSGAGLLPAADGLHGHQTRDFFPMAGNYDLFALLNQVKQLAEFVL